MNERPAPLILAMLFALLLGACSGAGSTEAPPLEGARLGGAFTLTNQEGRKVSESDFAGKNRIVYLGFTYCPDVCPVDLQVIGKAMRLLEKEEPELAARVQPIFITTDPERDGPAELKQYVSAFHPRLIGLTGTPEEIAQVTKQYGGYAQKGEVEGEAEYRVDHSRVVLLFGPKGEPLAILPHDQGPEAVAAEIKRWAR